VEATRSTDPRLHTPEFQQHQEDWAIMALDTMRLQPEGNSIPQSTVARNGHLSEIPSDQLGPVIPLPPTPPGPSQNRLEEERDDSEWNGDGHYGTPTTADGAERRENMIDGCGNGTTACEKTLDEDAVTREGGPVDDGDFREAVRDRTLDGDSLCSKRVYTPEELAVLTYKIFGGDDEEEDAAFWDDADVAPQAAIDLPGEHDEVDMVGQQGETSDIEPGESEGEAEETSRSIRLFGSTSNICSSTSPSPDGSHPDAHQDEEEGGNATNMQGALDAVAGSAAIDASEGLSSSDNDDTLSATTTSAVRTPLGPPLNSPNPSSLAQPSSPLPESGLGTGSNKDQAPIGNSWPGKSLEAGAGVDVDHSDLVPIPVAQGNPPAELEPRMAAINDPSTRRLSIRKKGLPDFRPTRPGIFLTVALDTSDNPFLGKRKRSREDDEGEHATTAGSASDREVLLPR